MVKFKYIQYIHNTCIIIKIKQFSYNILLARTIVSFIFTEHIYETFLTIQIMMCDPWPIKLKYM